MTKKQSTVRVPLTNRLAVLDLVSRYDEITRREIASILNYTPMTISNTVSALMQEGLLSERPSERDTGLGRRPNILDITENVPYIIGISMTRKSLKAALLDFKSRVIQRNETVFSEVKDQDELLSIIKNSIDMLLQGNERKVIAIGFSCFGPLNTNTGRILDAQFFFNMDEIDIKKPLEDAYGIPVVVIHDANASALAERKSGAAREIDNFIFIRITAGIGCGLVLNGQIYEGVHGLSGELGHTSIDRFGIECGCGQKGCIENYVNTDLITKRINEFHKFNPPLKWNDIVSLYNSPQEMFKEIMNDICEIMSHAIVNIVNLLDIDTVFLEYPGQDSGDKIERNIEEMVNGMIVASKFRHISVKRSTYREDSTLIGTADLVKDKVFSGEVPFFED